MVIDQNEGAVRKLSEAIPLLHRAMSMNSQEPPSPFKTPEDMDEELHMVFDEHSNEREESDNEGEGSEEDDPGIFEKMV